MGIRIDQDKCVGCGICLEFCPVKALFNHKGKTCVNEKCTACGNCRDVCICGAITVE